MAWMTDREGMAMTGLMRKEKAVSVYNRLIETLEHMGWCYDKLENDLEVRYRVNGEDIPMEFAIIVNEDTQMVQFLSILPMTFTEEKQWEAVMAVCEATRGLAYGEFSFNVANRKVIYTAASLFLDCEIDEEWFRCQMDYAHHIVDAYNDRFLALAKGYIDLEKFIHMD